MITAVRIDMYFSIRHYGSMNRTVVFHLADFTAFAFVRIDLWYPLSYYSKVIQIWFYTVIRTSAHGNFELVGQLNPV